LETRFFNGFGRSISTTSRPADTSAKKRLKSLRISWIGSSLVRPERRFLSPLPKRVADNIWIAQLANPATARFKLARDELAHRNKNTAAVLQSILRQSLSNDPEASMQSFHEYAR